MTYVWAVVAAVSFLVAAFVGGILVGRKNPKKVEKVVGIAKDPMSVVK